VTAKIFISWVESQLPQPGPETTMILRPLNVHASEKTVTVKAGEPAVITVVPGRYQLTTTKPLDVNGKSYGWDMELPLTQPVNDVELSSWNAVVLNTPAPTVPAAVPVTKPSEPSAAPDTRFTRPVTTSDTSSASDANTRAQITALLQRWTASLKSEDIDQQMSCYASELTTYFLKHNVRKPEIRRDKERFFARYPQIREIKISNLQITDTHPPEATFLKTWNFGGVESDWKGQVISHLVFTQENGRWVISSERERLVQVAVPFAGSTQQ
jgi:hypothetical protein